MALPLVELLFSEPPDRDVEGQLARGRRKREEERRHAEESANLVARIRGGDESAFTQVVYDLTPVLHAYARHYVPLGDIARDVVQDVFIRLWEDRATLVVGGTLRQYLFIATRLRALNALRRARLEWRYEGRGPVPTAAPPVDESMERLEQFVRVVRAVDGLPPRQQEIVRLRWLDQLSNAEVAARLGISIKGVEIQLTRALYALRRALR